MASKMTQIMKMKNEEEEQVRCICPDCWGEGWCFVSKKRAEELKAMELIEECCPFGDRCAARGGHPKFRHAPAHTRGGPMEAV